jgi:hypothetical protein
MKLNPLDQEAILGMADTDSERGLTKFLTSSPPTGLGVVVSRTALVSRTAPRMAALREPERYDFCSAHEWQR